MGNIDERDIMFSRMNYEENSPQYLDYYLKNPEKKEIDDELRNKLAKNKENMAYYNKIYTPLVDSTFRFLGDIKKYSEGDVNINRTPIDKIEFSSAIKDIALYFGAVLCGITEMKDYHFYSNRGRSAEIYGDEIDHSKHKYGIVFAVEMDKDNINRAPKLTESIEVTLGYTKAAMIGMMISYYIRELGYNARNHMDGNYLVLAPAVAQDAGLGELGRIGILVTEKYGPRVRLGVVTTDLELSPDVSKKSGIKEFCKICSRCAITCPGRAISKENPHFVNGVEKWQSNQESCFGMWTSLGTDCGVCLSSCPFSQNMNIEDISKLNESEEKRIEIFNKYSAKLGIRTFVKDNPKWMK